MWGTLLVNGTIVLGDVIQSQPFTIAANATTDYPVAINLKYAGIFTTIQNYLTNNTGTYTFNGYVTVYGIDIPLLLTYKL